jgi:hypothetical protein
MRLLLILLTLILVNAHHTFYYANNLTIGQGSIHPNLAVTSNLLLPATFGHLHRYNHPNTSNPSLAVYPHKNEWLATVDPVESVLYNFNNGEGYKLVLNMTFVSELNFMGTYCLFCLIRNLPKIHTPLSINMCTDIDMGLVWSNNHLVYVSRDILSYECKYLTIDTFILKKWVGQPTQFEFSWHRGIKSIRVNGESIRIPSIPSRLESIQVTKGGALIGWTTQHHVLQGPIAINPNFQRAQVYIHSIEVLPYTNADDPPLQEFFTPIILNYTEHTVPPVVAPQASGPTCAISDVVCLNSHDKSTKSYEISDLWIKTMPLECQPEHYNKYTYSIDTGVSNYTTPVIRLTIQYSLRLGFKYGFHITMGGQLIEPSKITYGPHDANHQICRYYTAYSVEYIIPPPAHDTKSGSGFSPLDNSVLLEEAVIEYTPPTNHESTQRFTKRSRMIISVRKDELRDIDVDKEKLAVVQLHPDGLEIHTRRVTQAIQRGYLDMTMETCYNRYSRVLDTPLLALESAMSPTQDALLYVADIATPRYDPHKMQMCHRWHLKSLYPIMLHREQFATTGVVTLKFTKQTSALFNVNIFYSYSLSGYKFQTPAPQQPPTSTRRSIEETMFAERVCMYNDLRLSRPYIKNNRNQRVYFKFDLVPRREMATHSCAHHPDAPLFCNVPQYNLRVYKIGLCTKQTMAPTTTENKCGQMGGIYNLIWTANPSSTEELPLVTRDYWDLHITTYQYTNCSSIVVGSFIDRSFTSSAFTNPSTLDFTFQIVARDNARGNELHYRTSSDLRGFGETVMNYLTPSLIGGCDSGSWFSAYWEECVGAFLWWYGDIWVKSRLIVLAIFISLLVLIAWTCFIRRVKKAHKHMRKKHWKKLPWSKKKELGPPPGVIPRAQWERMMQEEQAAADAYTGYSRDYQEDQPNDPRNSIWRVSNWI